MSIPILSTRLWSSWAIIFELIGVPLTPWRQGHRPGQKRNLRIRATTIALAIGSTSLIVGCSMPRDLQEAIETGDVGAVKRIVRSDPKTVNRPFTNQCKPLGWACDHGRIEIVELLLSEGADINARDGSIGVGLTALHRAIAKKHDNVAKLLLSKGVDVNVKDDSGRTPLHYAAGLGNKELAELLLSRGADVNGAGGRVPPPIYGAVMADKQAIVELLLTNGANPNIVDLQGKTLLQRAMEWSRYDIAEVLRQHGAKN